MFCRNWLKLRITFQPLMQKARVVEQKTQGSFVDSRETMWGESVWWAWPQSRFIDLKCCKFSALLWWLPPWQEGSCRPVHQHHHLDQPLGKRSMNFT